ncbi:hypothetical protein B0H10DRAFT_2197918 [Mycena sp. CBHHK59/15]|nr:hypothetical protein B0H10DRAFT_2197918 [Mycena sp. CBHHK59/15]
MASPLSHGSILVESVHTSSVLLSSTQAHTVLSSRFVRARLPCHSSPSYAFTINGGPHGSFTVVLSCTVSSSLTTDVCLGLDWKSSVREWYIGLGLSPAHGFDVVTHLRADPPRHDSSDVSLGAMATAPSESPSPPGIAAVSTAMVGRFPLIASLRSLASAVGPGSTSPSYKPVTTQYNNNDAYALHGHVFARDGHAHAHGGYHPVPYNNHCAAGPSTVRLASGPVSPFLPNGSPALSHLGCLSLASDFASPSHMSHAAYSVLISASLSSSQIDVVSGALNTDPAELSVVLARQRTRLLDVHNVSNPLNAIFDGVEQMWRPALVSLGALHGLDIARFTLDVGRDKISQIWV